MITRSQAEEFGLSRHVIERLRRSGDWRVLAPGVYFTLPGELSWTARAWAGVLIGGPGAVVAKLSAAVLHGLSDRESLPIQILVEHPRRVADRPWVRFQRQRHDVRMPIAAVLPPRTRLEDTVLDLCADAEPAEVITWVTKAVQRRLTTPAHLLAALRGRARLRHRRLIGEVLSDAASGVHSQLEYRFARDVARAHRLPPGQRQFRIPGTSRLADVAHEEFGVLIELDGRIGHVEDSSTSPAPSPPRSPRCSRSAAGPGGWGAARFAGQLRRRSRGCI